MAAALEDMAADAGVADAANQAVAAAQAAALQGDAAAATAAVPDPALAAMERYLQHGKAGEGKRDAKGVLAKGVLAKGAKHVSRIVTLRKRSEAQILQEAREDKAEQDRLDAARKSDGLHVDILTQFVNGPGARRADRI